MADTQKRLFCFGMGYSARVLAARLMQAGWRVAGTAREADKLQELADQGITAYAFSRSRPLADAPGALSGATHLLSSVPPDDAGDAVLDCHRGDIAGLPGLAWAGYLSTTGVYGDTGGATVDESAPLRPSVPRSRRRADAEAAWLALVPGVPVHVFRLAGIYGPGRSTLDRARAGTIRRIEKPGQVFSRIHVDDIAAVLEASMAKPRHGAVYNVCDDEAAAPADVAAFACTLLGQTPPPSRPFEDAQAEMSGMERSFWRDSRRIDNSLMKRELGIRLRYPDYRAGLRAVLEAETAGGD